MTDCMESSTRTRILARLATKEALLVKAYALYDKLMGQSVQEFRFASGEGSQQASRRKLKDVEGQINSLEASIDALYRRLGCKGIVNINVRRKQRVI